VHGFPPDLHRLGGETPFTKIEQRAIRDRAYDEGYGFTLFIPTEKKPTMPPWVERTRLYYSLERFGVDGAAAVVESKLQELGLASVIEGARDRAQRLERSLIFKTEKENFEHSEAGAQAGSKAYIAALTLMQGQVADLALSSTRLKPLHMEQRNNYWLLYGLGPWVLFNWTNRYSNVLDKAFLEAQYFYNQPQVPGLMTWEEPRKMKLFRYPFGLLRPGVSGFLDNGGDKREYGVEELAEQLLKTYLDEVENFKRR
jgi:hypothetical protein